MPQKAIIPPEEKIKAVEEYLSGGISVGLCASKYGVSKTVFKNWVRLYKNRGSEGLAASKKYRKYSVETKRQAVEEYLSQGSYSSICEKYDISTIAVLEKWIKMYNSHKDFRQPKIGGVAYMTKGRKTTIQERIEIVSYCISNNKDYGKTIEKHGVSYQQVYGWVKKYEVEGADGLIDRRGKRKNESDMTEIEKLRAQLKLKEAENLRLQMENELLKKLEELERGRGKN